LITRLKQRLRWDKPAAARVTLILMAFGDFPMMRRVLNGIKVRAERMSAGQAMPLQCQSTRLEGR
jgi:hypothetical protein